MTMTEFFKEVQTELDKLGQFVQQVGTRPNPHVDAYLRGEVMRCVQAVVNFTQAKLATMQAGAPPTTMGPENSQPAVPGPETSQPAT